MSDRLYPPVAPFLGTWFEDRTSEYRIYLPFGETRLNKMGLFYFRNHYWSRVEKLLLSAKLDASEQRRWVDLTETQKVLIEELEFPMCQQRRGKCHEREREKEIESEEEFIEVFGACPGWILSPVKLSDKHCGSKTEADQSKRRHQRILIDIRYLYVSFIKGI